MRWQDSFMSAFVHLTNFDETVALWHLAERASPLNSALGAAAKETWNTGNSAGRAESIAGVLAAS